jgi:DNA-binding MarR family transcriptional regulator
MFREVYHAVICCKVLFPMPLLRRLSGTPRVDYEILSELRYQIRRFLRVRELAARSAGIEPQQYLVLLHVKGLARRAPVSIATLAERLQVRHHAAVQLVDRLVRLGLVERRRGGRDRREVSVALSAAGEAILRRLAFHSVAELETEGPALVASLSRLIRQSATPPGRTSAPLR